MKKILFILFCSVAFIGASAQTGKVSVNAGFLFPSTLNATLGYEYPLSYGNAVEVYGEVGNHWQKPVCHNFWKGYFWDGGMGPQFGAVQKKFFFGLEAGFEYSYVFRSGLEFSVIQKNNVNFLHGDTFRNGLLLGIKIPF